MFELTPEQIQVLENSKKKIFEALKKGRELSLFDNVEFGCSQMHTQMHEIRKMIDKQGLPFRLVARKVRYAPGPGRFCFVYHLETISEDELNAKAVQLCLPLSS